MPGKSPQSAVMWKSCQKKLAWFTSLLAAPACMCPYGSPDESLWNTPIRQVALLLLSHDFTSKCMPRHDDPAQTSSPSPCSIVVNRRMDDNSEMNLLDVNELVVCLFVLLLPSVETFTQLNAKETVCSSALARNHFGSSLKTDHVILNDLILVILIPVNSSQPTRHSNWLPFGFGDKSGSRQPLLRMIMIICNHKKCILESQIKFDLYSASS